MTKSTPRSRRLSVIALRVAVVLLVAVAILIVVVGLHPRDFAIGYLSREMNQKPTQTRLTLSFWGVYLTVRVDRRIDQLPTRSYGEVSEWDAKSYNVSLR